MCVNPRLTKESGIFCFYNTYMMIMNTLRWKYLKNTILKKQKIWLKKLVLNLLNTF